MYIGQRRITCPSEYCDCTGACYDEAARIERLKQSIPEELKQLITQILNKEL